MRKRSRILLLIFCLLLFFPTQRSYGYVDGQAAGDLAVLMFQLFAPESWQGDCDSYYHPGDLYYEKNYKKLKSISYDIRECYQKCWGKMDKNVVMGVTRSDKVIKGESFSECFDPCKKDAFKDFLTPIATCKDEGIYGYYSDGSYYDSSEKNKIDYRFFDNVHELKDQYEKNEWQKARDVCMQIVSENKDYMKRQWRIDKSKEYSFTPNQKGITYYNNCLKERGY